MKTGILTVVTIAGIMFPSLARAYCVTNETGGEARIAIVCQPYPIQLIDPRRNPLVWAPSAPLVPHGTKVCSGPSAWNIPCFAEIIVPMRKWNGDGTYSRSPRTAHCRSNWIALGYQDWVFSSDAGKGLNREYYEQTVGSGLPPAIACQGGMPE